MIVFGCEAFHLGWEKALLDPLARDFTGPDDYDALNKVENNNYDLEYYLMKEKLTVAFAEKLEDKTETQGGRSQASKSGHPDPTVKDQVKSKSKVVAGTTTSDLKGCLEIPSSLPSSGGFDENMVIEFTPPILFSPDV